jgi:alcohol dehydrogenase
MTLAIQQREILNTAPGFMKANVFHGPARFNLEEKPIPIPAYGEAVIKVRLTTICGTDIHIVKGEYPVKPGLTIGHVAVGTIHEL